MAKLDIQDLPYVDGPPGEGQKRFQWIQDGEEITGATTKYGSDGVLNRPVTMVQKNAEVLEQNIHTVADSLDVANNDIATIKNILDVSTNIEALAQIGKNAKDIKELQDSDDIKTFVIEDIEVNLAEIKDDVGYYNPISDSVYRPVRDDLLWVKTEMGQYPGQDINGISVPGNDSTGMKRRIINNSSSISSLNNRVTILEHEFNDSDVGTLTKDVQEIRAELGTKPSIIVDPIYTRLSRNDTSIKGLNLNMEIVLNSIGYNDGITSLVADVKKNSTDIDTIESDLNSPEGIKVQIADIKTAIGSDSVPTSINGKINTNTVSIKNINNVLGADSSSGLRGQVAWINQTVGITSAGTPAPAGSLIYKVNVLTEQQNQMSNEIQNLQVEIGNNTEGIKGQVLKISSLINGTNPNGSTIEERGMLPTLKNHETRISVLRTDVNALMGGGTTDDIKKLREDLTALTETVNTQETDIITVAAELDDTQADVIRIDGAVSTNTTNITTVTGDLAKVALKVDTLDSDVTAAATEVAKLKTDVSGIDTTVAGLTSDNTTNKSDIATLKTDVTTLKTTTDGLTTSVGSLNTQVTTISSEVASLTTDVKANSTSIGTLTTQVTAVENTANTNSAEVVKIKTDLTALSDKVSKIDFTTQVEQLESDVGTLKHEQTDTSTKLTTAQADIQKAQGDIAALATRVDAIEKAGYITDAPKDGEAYVRKDGAWVLLSSLITP